MWPCHSFKLLSFVFVCTATGLRTISNTISWTEAQSVIQMSDDSWSLHLGDEWNVLGPFPIHAREQHFMSPSFPLNLSEPINYNTKWLSSYADFAKVGWTKALSQNGRLNVSFPEVRWSALRATEGWAALQYHSVLHTTITINPPLAHSDTSYVPRQVLVDLIQGSSFTILPRVTDSPDEETAIPQWYSGNIYNMGASTPQTVDLPVTPSMTRPTVYDLFISGDYEIRLFGDPVTTGREAPELQIEVTARLGDTGPKIEHSPSHDVVPNVVDGWTFGNALGVGVLSVQEWWTVTDIIVHDLPPDILRIELLQETRIAPTQVRIIPMTITQFKALSSPTIRLSLVATNGNIKSKLVVTVALEHLVQWDIEQSLYIRATYFYAGSMPTAFIAIPPFRTNEGNAAPPVLALHGAGVDILSSHEWPQAILRQNFSWTIAPTGRTAWGLDWHGPSNKDAWATVEATHDILRSHAQWRRWVFAQDSQVVVVGHSNGGQGTWYTSARHPDRVLVAIPAAGYIKSQAYVPLIHSRSSHFIDPSLRAILESSLTQDDNDLFLSNLVDTPILAIHGGDDENVPVWHSREAVSILKTWRPDAKAFFREDVGKPHWYPTVFDNDFVQNFLRMFIEPYHQKEDNEQDMFESKSFTLTVAIPSESGPLHGWEIRALKIPGRLSRLTIDRATTDLHVRTVNVEVFSVVQQAFNGNNDLMVDGQRLTLSSLSNKPKITFSSDNGVWDVTSKIKTPQPSGRLANILSSPAPLTLIIPDSAPPTTFSAALRIAHDLDVYHRLDSEIIDASAALERLETSTMGVGNLVLFGGPENEFTTSLLQQRKTPFSLQERKLYLNGKLVEESAATLFLHPHPTSSSSLALVLFYNNPRALERGLRLFPIRTGVAVPDWIITTEEADFKAAAGVAGAGVWGNEWTWNEGMSSF